MKISWDKQDWVAAKANKKADTLTPENVKRIAVIKHAGLGDMIATRPILNELKKAFPNAMLTISVSSNYIKGIAEDVVDRIHITKGSDKKYGVAETIESFKELGHQDIIFDITMTSRSFWITALNSATLKIGYKHKGIHRFIYDIAISRGNRRFEAETFLELLNTIGIYAQWPPLYNYPVTDKVYNKPYVIYFPTSSIPTRGWPLEKMASLIKNMCEKYPNMDHLLLTGLAEWEVQAAETVANEVGTYDNFKKLQAGPDDFSLICHASAMVSTDTGLRHLAIAAGTPTVCLFGLTFNISRYLPLFGKHKAAQATESGPASVETVLNCLDEILTS